MHVGKRPAVSRKAKLLELIGDRKRQLDQLVTRTLTGSFGAVVAGTPEKPTIEFVPSLTQWQQRATLEDTIDPCQLYAELLQILRSSLPSLRRVNFTSVPEAKELVRLVWGKEDVAESSAAPSIAVVEDIPDINDAPSLAADDAEETKNAYLTLLFDLGSYLEGRVDLDPYQSFVEQVLDLHELVSRTPAKDLDLFPSPTQVKDLAYIINDVLHLKFDASKTVNRLLQVPKISASKRKTLLRLQSGLQMYPGLYLIPQWRQVWLWALEAYYIGLDLQTY